MVTRDRKSPPALSKFIYNKVAYIDLAAEHDSCFYKIAAEHDSCFYKIAAEHDSCFYKIAPEQETNRHGKSVSLYKINPSLLSLF